MILTRSGLAREQIQIRHFMANQLASFSRVQRGSEILNDFISTSSASPHSQGKNSFRMDGLSVRFQKQITAVLETSPCGRCSKAHMLKNCPMGPNEGYKGTLWTEFSTLIRPKADEWLKSQPSYSPPEPDADVTKTTTKLTAPSLGYGTASQRKGNSQQEKWTPVTADLGTIKLLFYFNLLLTFFKN
jgi:hypothetical protein